MKRVAAVATTLAVFAVVSLSGDRAFFAPIPARPHSAVQAFLAPAPFPAGPLMTESRGPVELVPTGRGDKRTKRGKRFAKSFGKSRPRNSNLPKKKEGEAENKSEFRQVADFAILGGLTG